MLNRLLNEMDGLRERADVFFILTTNRPETWSRRWPVGQVASTRPLSFPSEASTFAGD
jgi:SpoVK/Ycf46/Vps4 family AAA+-type ATPase